MMWLDHGVFASLSTGTIAAGMFLSGAGVTTAADSNDYLIYNSTTGALYYDADGSGPVSTAQQIAYLYGAPSLAASDFLVV